MAVQTNYPSNIPAAVAGALVNMVPATIISRTVETADGVDFGTAVSQGTADKGVVAFGTGATDYVGIVVRDRSSTGVNPDGFEKNASARIWTEGAIWVVASVAVAADDPVYLVIATGAFTNVAGTDNVLISGARWDTSAAIGALAQVRK